MKETKQLTKILQRYDVKLRTKDTTVTHLLYGNVTVCTPLQFAAYEAAVKAQHLSWMLADCPPEWRTQTEMHNKRIADKDGFSLPKADLTRFNSKQAAEDYHYCKSLIMGDDLYFALLD